MRFPFVLLFCVVALPSFARSLAEKKAIRQAEEVLTFHHRNAFKEKCAVDLPVTIDWDSYAGRFSGTFNPSVAAKQCGAVLDSLRVLCDEPEKKPLLAKKVRALKCRFEEAPKQALAFEAGTVSFHHDIKVEDNAAPMREFFQKLLVEESGPQPAADQAG